MAGKKERIRSASQTPCLKGGTQVPEFLRVSNRDQFWSYLLRSSSWETWFQMIYRNPREEVQDWTQPIEIWQFFLLLVFMSLVLCDSPLPPAHSNPSNGSFSSVLALSKPTFSTSQKTVCYLDLRLSPSVELSSWNLRASTDFKEGTIKLTSKKPLFTDLISRQKFKWALPLLGVAHEEEKDEQIFSEVIVA